LKSRDCSDVKFANESAPNSIESRDAPSFDQPSPESCSQRPYVVLCVSATTRRNPICYPKVTYLAANHAHSEQPSPPSSSSSPPSSSSSSSSLVWLFPNRLRKKSVRVEIGGIFGDTKPSPATFLALLGQLCAICFSRFLAQTTFSATC